MVKKGDFRFVNSKKAGVASRSFLIIVLLLSSMFFVFADEFIDNTQANFDLGTYNGTEFNSTFVQLITQRDFPDNNITEASINMTDNIVLFHFNNDSTGENETYVRDLSDGSYNGTFMSSETGWTTAQVGNGLDFDGYDDYVELSAINISTELSISAWVKTTDQGHQYILTRWESGDGSNSYHFRVSNDGTIYGTTTTNGNYNAARDVSSTGTVDDGTWHHVAMVYNNSDTVLYIDGVEDGRISTTAGHLYDPSNNVRIGDLSDGGVAANRFNGTIDEVRVWNRSLTAAEVNGTYEDDLTGGRFNNSLPDNQDSSLMVGNMILLHLDSATPSDSSGLGKTVTNNGCTAVTGQVDAALDCTASEDDGINFLTDTTDFANQNYTFSVWFKRDATGQRDMILGREPYIQIESDDKLQWNNFDGSNHVYEYTQSIPAGQWVHAVVRVDSNITFFIDGSKETFVKNETANNQNNWNLSYFTTGNAWSADAAIDEVAIWNRSLSDSEIYQVYKRARQNESITLDLSLNESGYTRIADDVSGNENDGNLYNIYTGINSTSGQVNASWEFDGINDFVNLTDVTELNSIQKFTISGWYKQKAIDKTNTFYAKYNNANSNIILFSSTDGNLYFRVRNGDTTAGYFDYSTAMSSNEWTHIVNVFDGTGSANADRIKTYVNGVEQTLSFQGATMATSTPNLAGYEFHLGSTLNGSVDEFAIWNRSLSAKEIESIYYSQAGIYQANYTSQIFDAGGFANWDNISWYSEKGTELPASGTEEPWVNTTGLEFLYHMDDTSGNIVDSSGNGRDASSVTGSPVYRVGGYVDDYALDFNEHANENYITIPALGHTPSTYSISMWFYHRGYSGVNQDILTTSSLFTIRFDLNNGIAFYENGWGGWASYEQNQWQHLMITYDGTDMRTYVNGILKDTTNNPSQTWQNNALKIASGFGGEHDFNGTIDEIAMWNRTLSTAEVLDIYAVQSPTFNMSVRTCDDSACSGESWTKLSNETTPMNLNLSGNRYFQYKTDFSTNNTLYTASVYNVTVGATNITPTISIGYPLNETYANMSEVNITFTNASANDTCWYTFDFGATNTTFTCANITNFVSNEENNSLIVYMNDTRGDIVSDDVNYTQDSIVPAIQFEDPTPANNAGKANNFDINVSISDIRLQNISYYWNGSEYNISDVVNLSNSLAVMLNFDNTSEYSENDTYAYDFSGNSNNGIGYNFDFDEVIAGKYTSAVDFLGSDDYMRVDNVGLDLSAFTYSLWIKFNDDPNAGGDKIIFGVTNADSDDEEFIIYNNQAAASGEYSFWGPAFGSTQITSSKVLAQNTWTHLAGVYNGTAIILYADGAEVGSSTATNPGAMTEDILLGVRRDTLGYNKYFNGSIDEFAMWNRSLSAEEIKALYYYQFRRYSAANFSINHTTGNSSIVLQHMNDTDWEVKVVQSNLTLGESYLYNVSVSDVVGNFNYTDTRTILGNSYPTFQTVTTTPASLNDLDPGVNVSVRANVSEAESSPDTAILYWKNVNESSWTEVTMTNLTAKGEYTLWEGNFTFPDYEGNFTYNVTANDTEGAVNDTLANLTVYWDCTWWASSELGAAAGYNENKEVANLTINNTGDSNHSDNNCDLNFKLIHDLTGRDTNNDLRIYYNNTGSGSYSEEFLTGTITAKQNVTIPINASFFLNGLQQDDVVINITDLTSRSNKSASNATLSLLTSNEGPYLYNTITSSPVSVDLTPGNISLESYMENLMGSSTVNTSNTAYNVTHYWTLPSGFTNSSGSLIINYTNMSNTSRFYNNINATFSDLGSFAPGTYTFVLSSYGFNSSGERMLDVDGNNVWNDTVQVSFQCYSTVDGVEVTECGSLDGDYIAPSTTTPDSGDTGGGGGGGSASNVVQVATSADFQLVRGEQNEVSITFTNTDLELSLTDLTFEVTGNIAKYIKLEPDYVAEIKPLGEFAVKLIITSPGYIELGKQQLVVRMEGKKGKRKYADAKSVILEIHELSGDKANSLLNESEELILKLREINLSYQYLEDLLNESMSGIEVFNYELVRDNAELIKEVGGAGLESYNIINELGESIDDAIEKGINVAESERLLKLAKLSLERMEFLQAYDRAKEAQVMYALEVKGELGNVGYYLREYPIEISLSAFLLGLASVGVYRLDSLRRIKKRIRYLKQEEKIIEDLTKVVQKETFKDKKMSMREYKTTMEEYNKKLASIIEELIELESKRVHILKFTSGSKKLGLEKKKVTSLIKQLQEDYLKHRKVETRTYELKMESFNKRVSEIEEKLATLEAKKAVKKAGIKTKDVKLK